MTKPKVKDNSFSDIATLRERARKQIADGAVTWVHSQNMTLSYKLLKLNNFLCHFSLHEF